MRSSFIISFFVTGIFGLFLACTSPVEQREITVQKSGELLYADHQEKLNISWAPDSSKIAYQTPRATLILLQYSLNGEMVDSLGVLTVPYWNGEVSSIEVSPDGQRVVYQVSDTRFRLVSLFDSHTKSFSIPDVEFLAPLTWSLDGENLYAPTRANGAHFMSILNVAAGTTRAIALDSLNAFHSAQLFEGDQILYTGFTKDDRAALWYKNSDGRVTRIAPHLAYDMTLFDENDAILFSHYNENNDIVISNYSIATGTTTPLSQEFESVRLFKRIENQQRLYFLGRHPSLGSHLFSMSLTGEWQPLSDWLPPYFFSWSEDGQSIIQQGVSQKIYSAVHVYDLLQQTVTDLTPGSHFSLNETPVFTANSEEVVFSRNGRLVRLPAVGGDITFLTPENVAPLYNPEVSPDGQLVLCDDGENIFIVPVAGGEVTNISSDSPTPLSNPTWSPDGKQVACESETALQILNFDGQSLISTRSFSGQFRHIEWARRGVRPFDAQIIYRHDIRGIATIHPETGERYESFVFNADLTAFCWAPNGREIAYTTPYLLVRSPLFTSLSQ